MIETIRTVGYIIAFACTIVASIVAAAFVGTLLKDMYRRRQSKKRFREMERKMRKEIDDE